MKEIIRNKKIWDLPLRLFHISLILLIIGSISSAKLNTLDLHQYFGVALLGLVFFEYCGGFLALIIRHLIALIFQLKMHYQNFQKLIILNQLEHL